MGHFLSLTLFGLVACSSIEAGADTIVINATYSGWYRSGELTTPITAAGASAAPAFTITSWGTDPSDTVRNYLVFDLSGVTGLETLTGSQLRIFSPISSLTSFGPGYGSTDREEI